MPERHTRPPRGAPLSELQELREQKFPGVSQEDFAKKMLGISRLHLIAIEQGRRRPSLDLILRWRLLLGPRATLDKFGPLPIIEGQLALLRELQQQLETSQAA